MYFKIDKATELYTKLKEIQVKMKAANNAAYKLAKELGFEQWRSKADMLIAGGIVSLYSKDGSKPDGYRYTYGSDMPNDVFPKKTKANKEILSKIEALPTVSSYDYTDIINYDWRQHVYPTGERNGQNRTLFAPSLSFPKNGEVLIHMPDWITKYEPVKGMIEITFTEYKKLNK